MEKVFIAKTYEVELEMSRTAPNADLNKIKKILTKDFPNYIDFVVGDDNGETPHFEIDTQGIWIMIAHYQFRYNTHKEDLDNTITELLKEIVIVAHPSKTGRYAVFYQ